MRCTSSSELMFALYRTDIGVRERALKIMQPALGKVNGRPTLQRNPRCRRAAYARGGTCDDDGVASNRPGKNRGAHGAGRTRSASALVRS